MTSYNFKDDVHANFEMKKDFRKLLIESQVKDKIPNYPHHHPIAIRYYRRKEWVQGLGVLNPFFYLTVLGFTYVGGYIAAKKQFIHGLDYYRNHYFDFVGGRRPIIISFILGVATAIYFCGDNKLFYENYRAVKWYLRDLPSLDKYQRNGKTNLQRRITDFTIWDDL